MGSLLCIDVIQVQFDGFGPHQPVLRQPSLSNRGNSLSLGQGETMDDSRLYQPVSNGSKRSQTVIGTKN